jgi:tetratricopeptide (TPR) repeat protein
VPGLEVIARGSSNEYRGTSKRSGEIARELGAGYLLTGTVRWTKTPDGGSRVRVTPELVEVRPGQAPRSRWGRQFDAGLTDVFQVQAEIAGRVVSALDVALADSLRRELAAKPTENLEAYDAFLKGEAAAGGLSAGGPSSLRRAIAHYELAVALDRTFLPAQAQLARAYSFLYGNTVPTPELAEKARLAAERTRALAPERPDAFLALGTYQGTVLREDARALATLEAGLRLAPGNVDLLTAVGQREQALGRWESALARYERAAALDPRSVSAARRYAYALMALRRYSQADVAYGRARALAPSNLTVIHEQAMLQLARGDRAAAERVARTPLPGVDPAEQAVYFGRYEELAWLLSDDQQRLLLSQPPEAFDDPSASGFVRAQVYAFRGDAAKSRAYADSARMAYEEQLREAPDDAQLHALHGVDLAFLGRYNEAIGEAERGVDLMPISKDAYFGPYIALQLARVYMIAGRHDDAVARLEELIRIPNNLSAGWLRVDPTWDPLRKHPGFQKLVAVTP